MSLNRDDVVSVSGNNFMPGNTFTVSEAASKLGNLVHQHTQGRFQARVVDGVECRVLRASGGG